MTNEEIRAIKPGDELRLYHMDGAVNGVTTFRVARVRTHGRGTTLITAQDRFAIVEPQPFPGMKYETLVVESDEYLTALGFATVDHEARRIRGVEKVVYTWSMMTPPATMFGGKP